jgi:molybdenum cofactor cytidylyltransferase
LGHPKQLVVYAGEPLVVRAAQAALEAGASPVIVVIGGNPEAVRAPLAALPVLVVENVEWASGMGSSIAAGVSALVSHSPLARGVLVTLADQPLVDALALRRLFNAWAASWSGSTDGDSAAAIAAAAYAGTVGVPAVFGSAHFDALCSLPAAAGAARLLRTPDARVRRVSMPEAVLDLDTPSDLEQLARRP